MTAFEFLERHASVLESDYGYKGADGACLENKYTGVTTVSRYDKAKTKSAEALKEALNKGVVAIAVDAAGKMWDQYTGGIFPLAKCSPLIYNLDHAVAAVGYGSEDGQGYFIVRNSWTADWGEKGYIRLPDDAGPRGLGCCGIFKEAPSWPTTP